jgi:hypothetical protein
MYRSGPTTIIGLSQYGCGEFAMAQYDPETLIVLQKAFDAAWAAVPDDSKSEARKSELAQLIFKLAADGARSPAGRRTGSLADSSKDI